MTATVLSAAVVFGGSDSAWAARYHRAGWHGGGWHHAGWRGAGWHGGGWRGTRVGWNRGGWYGGRWWPGAAAAGIGVGLAGTAANYGYGYPYYDYSYTAPGAAPVVTGRSVAEAAPGNFCTTSVRTCLLYETSFIGNGCSCKVSGGRARGSVTH
jgi:hypothetical protein